jgi:diguanylate cyclase (GGDEF)-like protein
VRRLAVLLLLLTGGAVLLWVPDVAAVEIDAATLRAGFYLALAFLIFEGTQAHIEMRRQGFSLSLSEAPLVVGLALVAPPVLLISRLAASVCLDIYRISSGRTAAVKAAFNLALAAAETGIAVRVSQALSDVPPDRPQGWLAAYGGILTADLASAVFVTVAVSATQGFPTRREFANLIPRLLVGGVLTISLGLVAATAIRLEPLSAIVLSVVGVLVLVTYRSYAGLSQRHATLGEVHAFAQRVVGAPGSKELLALLLTDSARLVAAETATVWLTEPPPGMPRGLRLRHEGDLEELDALPTDGVRRKVLVDGASVVLARGSNPSWLAAQGVREALLVALPGGSDHPLGLLELDDRLVDMSTFSEEDARAAEALAAHVAIALHNDWLRELSVHDATHDRLTGLPNRSLLAARLSESVDPGAAVLLVDLDRFQEVNDSLGHASGDSVLRQVAQRLIRVVPDGGTVARLGNDEFAVLLPGNGLDEAMTTARALRTALLEPVLVEGLGVDVSGAVGIAVAPEHGQDPEMLLRRAEAALRKAKAAEPPVQAWSTAMEPSDPRRLARVGELRKALESNELEVHYQPKVRLPGGEVLGVEALVRWQHPEDGLLPSDEFLPMAERTGLVVPMTRVVLRMALQQCRRWLDGGRRVPVAVNLSVRGLLDPDLIPTIRGLLATYRLPPDMLSLEITESSVMADVPRTLPVLKELADSGLSLSVDDFGTGYSSLAYLRQLPVSEVKIDKSFVRDMGTEESDAAIVSTIIGLARQLGLSVVAEGVEDEGSRDRLVEMGCDVAQGYLFSRPLPPDRLDAWFTARDGTGRSRVRLLRGGVL